jgi:hypothetical protein
MREIRIGKCIYCRTTQGPLKREHMIAAGLNGPWVLTRASCKSCEKITSAFEGHVLGRVFGLARAGLKMHMKERPTTLPVEIDRGDGQFVEVHLPVEECPAIVQFPEFLPPAYLDAREYRGGIELFAQRMIQFTGPTAEDVGRKLGAKGMRWTTTFRGHTFPRMIAKIAYTFVVADIGLDSIETAYVLPAIMGQSEDTGRWVGCDGMEYVTDPGVLHGVAQAIVNNEVIVRVRLFASSGAPEYVVVVGRLRADAVAGKFKVSGRQGFSRTRSLAEAQATARQAPEPFTQPNASLTVKLNSP